MKFLKKWWFWVIIIIIIALVSPEGQKNEETINKNSKVETSKAEEQKTEEISYETSFDWNSKNTKVTTMEFNNGDIDNYTYAVLGIENKKGDLKAGEYTIKTNDNQKSSFLIYVTDKYYENPNDIEETYYYDMIQGLSNSETTVNVTKGQYLYICQSCNGEGKVYVNLK